MQVATQAMAHWRLSPLNQVAMLKLKAAGIETVYDQLPVFQLMEWGMGSGLRLPYRRMLSELERLQQLEPDAALAYLSGRLPGDVHELERALLSLSPRAAAELLLDTLDMQLKADPGNPYPE